MPRNRFIIDQYRAGWADHTSRYYTRTNTIVVNPMPDLFAWEAKPTPSALPLYFTIIHIHELTHWAGHEHETPEQAWGWNDFIERIAS